MYVIDHVFWSGIVIGIAGSLKPSRWGQRRSSGGGSGVQEDSDEAVPARCVAGAGSCRQQGENRPLKRSVRISGGRHAARSVRHVTELVEVSGIEPLTFCVQNRRSPD